MKEEHKAACSKCRNAGFEWHGGDYGMPVFVGCRADGIVAEKFDPYTGKKFKIYGNPHELNKNGDCPYFGKKLEWPNKSFWGQLKEFFSFGVDEEWIKENNPYEKEKRDKENKDK